MERNATQRNGTNPKLRGGILEPPGICEVKFRKPDMLGVMHRTDAEIMLLDGEAAEGGGDSKEVKGKIAEREESLLPVYQQIAHEFADLHDRSGRMMAKGVVRDVVPWEKSREYFHYRIKRRLVVDEAIKQLKKADSELTSDECAEMVRGVYEGDWESDKDVLGFFEEQGARLEGLVGEVKQKSLRRRIGELEKELE